MFLGASASPERRQRRRPWPEYRHRPGAVKEREGIEERKRTMLEKRKWILIGCAVLAALAGSAGVVRAYTVVGPSDPPTLLWGDLVLANTAAYGVRVPFRYRSLGAWRDPARGDMVLFKVPGHPGAVGFKRVVGVPGDTIDVVHERLVVNGEEMERRERADFDRGRVAARNEVGSVVALESGGMSQEISCTPAELAEDEPLALSLSPGMYLVLGDNRTRSNDSRAFGPIPRSGILGKLLVVLRRAEGT